MIDLEKHRVILEAFAKLDRYLDQRISVPPAPDLLESHRAFIWSGDTRRLNPVRRPVRIEPASLMGIDDHKAAVLDNTERFLSGSRANNVLLWGERGTGKSSLIKCLITAFEGTALRMVQVPKHDILTVHSLFDTAAGNPGFRFILFLDDFSFEENQGEYREMKTIMDGGLEQVPENLLFYATSNHKHLIPTRFSDRESDDIRPGDSMEEKVSLADRFGIRLGFYHISQETFLAIVDHYAGLYGAQSRSGEVHEWALRWALSAGARNGRVAEQFARSLRGGR